MDQFSRHCKKCYKLAFFYYFSGLPHRFAPRNDGACIHATNLPRE
ncbi:hypothetical protein RAMDARK_1307 [Rickettsia amblyommatis str. Darkwater]|uniref:Uncharacterized protein n=1 Tax=Rickettsia amblyommatis str. Ac/Pa TaxID=1359164 RepID=A0A0F3N706_RICAM|nr:hypothetical protein APHACPA_1728 [Rickettsia amblyommatis str. Ac/Pa]KJV90825.1 hypothetical protein RAMDARK_1307 [Rickettsia amblyommatis str. Darkwater]